MDSDFTLHERLAEDTIPVDDTDLCKVLLMNDSRYPWLILVPKRAGIKEIHELTAEDQTKLLADITYYSQKLQNETKADKMNVAALGNMVPQLHIHIIARFQGDDAWPGPVWGVHPAKPYDAEEAQTLKAQLLRLSNETLPSLASS